jgi:hypothetical protein
MSGRASHRPLSSVGPYSGCSTGWGRQATAGHSDQVDHALRKSYRHDRRLNCMMPFQQLPSTSHRRPVKILWEIVPVVWVRDILQPGDAGQDCLALLMQLPKGVLGLFDHALDMVRVLAAAPQLLEQPELAGDQSFSDDDLVIHRAKAGVRLRQMGSSLLRQNSRGQAAAGDNKGWIGHEHHAPVRIEREHAHLSQPPAPGMKAGDDL